MPQIQMPIFPPGVTHITNHIAFQRKDGKVCYLNGHLPVFLHDQDDLQTLNAIVKMEPGDFMLLPGPGLPQSSSERFRKKRKRFWTKAFPMWDSPGLGLDGI